MDRYRPDRIKKLKYFKYGQILNINMGYHIDKYDRTE